MVTRSAAPAAMAETAPALPATAADPSNAVDTRIDLLHPTPLVRVDLEATKLAIALAFASGVSGGLFSDALDRATVAPSTWQPSAFTRDLFVQNFVSLCFKVRAPPERARLGGSDATLCTNHLVRVLTNPPQDPAAVDHRRAIISELIDVPEMRARLEKLYAILCRFRTLLEGAVGIAKFDANRRQLDLLGAVKETIDHMTEFRSAKSGLSVLAAFAERVRRGEPYKSLSDLLRYDEKLATLDLKVSVGADGNIRGFQVLSVVENRDNPFVGSPVRRWLAKVELFLRGYRFSEGEVMARLIDAVFAGIEDDVACFVQLFGDIEFYLGALGFRDHARASGLAVCMPDLVAPEQPRVLHGLFNPLLLAHGIKPIPCDVDTDRHDTTLLLTGPNSGGKTRLLQSIGLCQLLAQSGLFVPARKAALALAPALVVSLIQETRADQAEGRLGMELMRIRELFESLPPGAMVILDELCSGTNPSEGEEIFELVIRMLTRLRPQAFITTHFLAFAARLKQQAHIADLRYLQVVLGPNHEPTYQFEPGVATTSLAGHAAARLGVTGDQLLSLVDKNIALAKITAEK